MSTATANPLAPWTAMIPSGWRAFRLAAVGDITFSNVDKHTIEGERSVQLCNYTDVYKNERISSSISFMQASALPREIEKFQLRKGDVLATKDSEDPNDIAISALVSEDLPNVLCGYHLALIRSKPSLMYSEFLAWVQSSKGILQQYEAQAVGVTRFALSHCAFKEAIVPVPHLDEQRRIVLYLDETTRKIDRLMELRRRQIELLRQQRAAIIQEAVTRGIDKKAPLKDSGLPWLGQIPAHWELMQLRRLIKPSTSITYGIVQAGPHVEGGIPYIRTSDMSGEQLPLDGYLCTSTEIDRSYKRSKVSTGDVVVAIRATIGKPLPVPAELAGANLTQGTAKISPGKRITTQFLLAALRTESSRQQFGTLAKGTTFLEITLDMLRRFVIPLPPLKEQDQVVVFIERETDKIDSLLSAYSRQLELLTEYRAAMIFEHVTGQRIVPQSISEPMCIAVG